ncbi:hypothetical protein IV203_018933 [Nitzschia inconspicua]|uniref:protein-serine/threonine phosphatase n=1 Tax=Nitzschia inconspicua TaxID=303405 RepID=A0A9K3Q728_9STRA|nr:hypothetical protein IV203_018933 [Nitzschia inconspicua]
MMTKEEELERLQQELVKANEGDLGQHVKSPKRIFPCGGTIAAVVDDREDVWANADDNSDSTIKGEPPENLLLVRPYHWQPFAGFADINNAAGTDLSESKQGNNSNSNNTNNNTNNTNNKDPYNEQDEQLLWTRDIVDQLHQQYYYHYNNQQCKTTTGGHGSSGNRNRRRTVPEICCRNCA